MYKKVLFKITLLLSNASMYATNAKQALGSTVRGIGYIVRQYSQAQKTKFRALLEAIKNQEIEIAQTLLKNGSYNLSDVALGNGHSLAYTVIINGNTELLELLCTHGARLFEHEQKEHAAWATTHPSLFRSAVFISEFAPYDDENEIGMI